MVVPSATSSPLLQLPIELLELIGGRVATGPTLKQSVENALLFGGICTATHALSSTGETGTIIAQGKTIVAIANLTKAIVDRKLTCVEVGLPKSEDEQGNRSMEKAKCAALYEAFRAKIAASHIKPNSDAYVHQATAIQQTVRDRCLEAAKAPTGHFNIPMSVNPKITTALRTFTKKVINDMIAEYAKQPLRAITIESFQKITGHLNELDKKLEIDRDGQSYSINDEATLRKAILAAHGQEAFTAAANNEDPQIASFYTELSRADFEAKEDQGIRSFALHNIIDKREV